MPLIHTRPQASPSINGLTISIINGQSVLTLEDSTRGNKKLSVAEQVLIFSENQLAHLDWLEIGNANHADTGYIANLDGTIVYASAHCRDTGANNKDINIFINGADNGSIGNLAGGLNATFNNTTLNLDFVQGDKIRLRAVDISGPIQDTAVKVTIKWRG